jgi:hypothetical protein
MILKLRCCKCSKEETSSNHSEAWLQGWDFIGQKQYCPNCSVMPSPKDEKIETKNGGE